MNDRSTIMIYLTLLVGTVCVVQANPAELLRLKFDEQIAGALTSREGKMNRLMAKYISSLENLNTAYRKTSDLDAVLAVMNELERVQSERSISTGQVNLAHKHLGALQRKVLGYYAGMRKAEATEIVSLTKTFSRQLKGLQVKLTKEGRIQEAIAAKAMLDEVLNGPDYTSAQAYLSPAAPPESAPTSPSSEYASTSDPNRDRSRSSPFSRSESGPRYGKIKLYAKGAEPKRTSKKEQAYQTGTASISAGSKIIATLQKITEESTKSKSRDYYSSSRDISKAYIPRLVFAAGPSHNFKDATLMFEYYTRSGNKRSLVKTDKIQIPILESMKSMVADAEGYSNVITKTQGSYYESSSRSSEKPEYYGFIASIYDNKGDLIYQRCTNKSLAAFGKTKLERLR